MLTFLSSSGPFVPPRLSRCAFLFMDLAIIGSGYVGLVTGACFADVGHNVICVDNDLQKIEAVAGGQGADIRARPGGGNSPQCLSASAALHQQHSGRSGEFTDHLYCRSHSAAAKRRCRSQLSGESRARNRGVLTGYRVIVDKSTVPVKTGEKVAESIQALQSCTAPSFDVVSNPEFLREGCAVADLMQPGPDRDWRAKRARHRPDEESLRTLHGADSRDRYQQRRTYQTLRKLISRSENFIHQCGFGDLRGRAALMSKKSRMELGWIIVLAVTFLNAGIGYGGSCFPKGHCRIHHDQRTARRSV